MRDLNQIIRILENFSLKVIAQGDNSEEIKQEIIGCLKSNLVEARVSPTEPTQPQQVFTIEEVKGWLKQQRANCASAFVDYGDYAYIKQNTKETISTLKEMKYLMHQNPK